MADGTMAGAASGASIGTKIMPGWGTAIGAVAGGLMGAASSSSPSAPSQADPYNQIVNDFSGWTVSTGSSKALGATTGATVPDWLKFAALGLAAVVAVRWIARKH